MDLLLSALLLQVEVIRVKSCELIFKDSHTDEMTLVLKRLSKKEIMDQR